MLPSTFADAFGENMQANPLIEHLTTREIQVLGLISNGLSNREIAQKLFLTLDTVKWYNRQIFRKLGVNNRMQAVNLATQQGLLQQEFDPQKGSNLQSGNLPAQLTSFVGRVKEIEKVKQLLKSNRLVVLTGPGGSGKSRLALQVAAELSGPSAATAGWTEPGIARKTAFIRSD